MLTFLRKVRRSLIESPPAKVLGTRAGGSARRYFFYAFGEILLVMVGILLALQVNNWNESKKLQKEGSFILQKLKTNIENDILEISNNIRLNNIYVKQYIDCLDILSGNKEATKEEFLNSFSNMFTTGGFDPNRATFDNLISSGKIEIIQNQELLDSLVLYYNFNYKAWDTALSDYARNITAPYLLNFDLAPEKDWDLYDEGYLFTRVDNAQFDVPVKTLSDYKSNIFIINSIKQKLFNTEGQLMVYDTLKNFMYRLVRKIKDELDREK